MIPSDGYSFSSGSFADQRPGKSEQRIQSGRESGKFQRLGEICCELAERQGKAVVFTQFREIAAHLADFLAGVFGRAGPMLHGQTAVAKRRELVEAFQRGEGRHFSICRSRPAAPA